MAEIKHTAAVLFAAEANRIAYETTPNAISAEMIEWCESFGTSPPVYVPVQQDTCGLFGFCNIGVAEKIKTDGGTIRFGWIIWEYPRLMLTAEFHAAWVSPTRKLVDITPKPAGETQIVFAADPSYPPDFDFLKRPNNRRSRTYQPADRADLAQANIANFTESQIQYETGRATRKGLTLEQCMEARVPIDPLPDLIDAFIRDAGERESLLKLVSTGIVQNTNPQRVSELARNQQRYLSNIRKLIRPAKDHPS